MDSDLLFILVVATALAFDVTNGFHDTAHVVATSISTLVAIVGLQDLLGIGKSVTAQKEFIGLHREVYAFVAVLFFVCCYAMSYASRRLEQALGVGER